MRQHQPRAPLVRATALYLSLTFLPEVLRVLGAVAVAPAVGGAALVTRVLDVPALGCEACEAHVRGALQRVAGVVAAYPSFRAGTVEVVLAPDWQPFDEASALALLAKAGYPVATSAS